MYEINTLRNKVRAGLDESVASGYFDREEMWYSATAHEIVSDIVAYDDELNAWTVSELYPHVAEWLAERKSHG